MLDDVYKESLHDWLDNRPPPERPANAEIAEPRWPRCRYCGEPAKPGKACAATRCPWRRDGGRIIALTSG